MNRRTIISVDVDHFPGSETGIERLLALLEDRGIKAPFFITGKFAEENHKVIEDIQTRGHEIGCHGYSHGLDTEENFVDIGLDQQRIKIRKATTILERTTDAKVKLFRAPYGWVNSDTIRALEELEYDCDSSITALRFDFGMGVGNNLRAFFAPTRPYSPSRQNIFGEGDLRVTEVPLSAFIAPLTLSSIRNLGVGIVCRLFNLAALFFDPVVFYLHPWEVMEVDEIGLWEGVPARHLRNRGAHAITALGIFLEHVTKRSDTVLYGDVLGNSTDKGGSGGS